jgi:restriction system protein
MFQAKRYAEGHNIGASPIRELKGTVVGKYDRGIFVTTSAYTAGAREEVEEGGGRIVLIDAERLIDLLLDARLGVKAVVERAELDEDAFAGLER